MTTTNNTGLVLLKKELPELAAIMSLTNAKANTEVMALQEIEYLEQIAMTNQAILECLPESFKFALKAVLKQNLTLDPNAGLVYVKTRNVKHGETWVKVLEIQPSVNGLVSINRQAGRILDVERPVIKKDDTGKVISVSVRYMVPSYNELLQPIARWVSVEFDESDFKRWMVKSHQENSRGKNDAATKNYANANYFNFNQGPDPEFIRAKAIRHAIKKLGTNPNEQMARIVLPNASNFQPIVEVKIAQEEAVEEAQQMEYTDTVEEIPSGNVNSNNVPSITNL